MNDTGITYDDAMEGDDKQARRAFHAALECGKLSVSALDLHFVGDFVFAGDDSDPKSGRPAKHFIFSHDMGERPDVKVEIPTGELEEDAENEQERPPSYITPGHVQAFQWVQQAPDVTLTSVLVNDKPAVAIVRLQRVSRQHLAVQPLFVSIEDGAMEIEYVELDHAQGRRKKSGKAGGEKPTRPFNAVVEVTKAAPKTA